MRWKDDKLPRRVNVQSSSFPGNNPNPRVLTACKSNKNKIFFVLNMEAVLMTVSGKDCLVFVLHLVKLR